MCEFNTKITIIVLLSRLRETVELKLPRIALKRAEILRTYHKINRTRRQGEKFWCIFISILMPYSK